MFDVLRRSVALWICPELGPVRRSSGVGFLDAEEARKHAEAVRVWLRAERKHAGAFFSPDERAALSANLRHRDIESAKEILQIMERVKLHGFAGDPDFTLDGAAERLALLVFGKR